MNKFERLAKIQNMVKDTFDFSEVEATLSKEDDLCNVAVTYNNFEWKVTQVHLNSPPDEINHLIKLALFNNKWEEEYTISPQTKIVSTIIDEFNLNDMGYYLLRNTLYEEDEDGCGLDELTGTSRLKKLSVIFDDSGGYVDKLVLTTSEGRFVLGEGGAKYEPTENRYKSTPVRFK